MKKFVCAILGVIMTAGIFTAAACNDPSAHAHKWDGGEVTTPATCTAEGVKTYKCTVSGCEETRTEKINKTDHKYDEGKVTSPASCKEEGVKTFTCSGCGGTYTQPISKTDHTYVGKLTKIPDLEHEGETTFTCSVCTDVKTQKETPRDDFSEQFYTALPTDTAWEYGSAANFDEAENTFEYAAATVAPETPAAWAADGVEISAGKITSSKNAVIVYNVKKTLSLNLTLSFEGEKAETRLHARLIVSRGGEIISATELDKADEKDWNYTSEKSLDSEAGDRLFLIFINKGEADTAGGKLAFRVEKACEHVWDGGVITTPAKCDADGVKTYTCSKCGNTKTEAVTERPDHVYEGEYIPDGANGHHKNCKNCGAAGANEEHVFEDVEVVEEATNDKDGVMKTACTVCRFESTRPIPALNHHKGTEYGKDGDSHWFVCSEHTDCNVKFEEAPHDYTEKVEGEGEPATCQKDGYEVWACVCGATRNVTLHKEDVEHSWDEGEITINPAFGKAGEKTFTCGVCNGTKTESVDMIKQTTAADGFTGDGNGWQFGTSDYKFEPDRFDFTAFTQKSEGGDAYLQNGSEIKAGWFSSANFDTFITVAYTFAADVKVEYTVTFKGRGGEDKILSDYALRIGVKDKDGNMDGTPEYAQRGTEYTVTRTREFKAGDTVYFILKHETNGWDQGDYSVTLKVVEDNA